MSKINNKFMRSYQKDGILNENNTPFLSWPRASRWLAGVKMGNDYLSIGRYAKTGDATRRNGRDVQLAVTIPDSPPTTECTYRPPTSICSRHSECRGSAAGDAACQT